MNITELEIETLRAEAAAAGDAAMIAICDLALEGDEDARFKCEDAVSSAASLVEANERDAAYAARRLEGIANGTW